MLTHPFLSSRVLKFDGCPQERDPSHPEDQVLRGAAEVPAGPEALRREGRDRTVFPGTSQHDGQDQGITKQDDKSVNITQTI